MKLFLLLLFFSYLITAPPPALALCVKSARANLRSGPGTRFSKTWEVFKYMPFRHLKRKGLWIKVGDVDGDTHWIHSKLVTSSIHYAVVKAKKANLRTGPGTNYRKKPYVPRAEKYTSYKVIRTKRGWSKLKDEYGDTAWVHRKLLWVQ